MSNHSRSRFFVLAGIILEGNPTAGGRRPQARRKGIELRKVGMLHGASDDQIWIVSGYTSVHPYNRDGGNLSLVTHSGLRT